MMELYKEYLETIQYVGKILCMIILLLSCRLCILGCEPLLLYFLPEFDDEPEQVEYRFVAVDCESWYLFLFPVSMISN
jgi:hypothetical protein